MTLFFNVLENTFLLFMKIYLPIKILNNLNSKLKNIFLYLTSKQRAKISTYKSCITVVR